MKLVKSLLLGSAAGLAAVAGAQAADLPAKKAAPVEYVRVCSTYGAGFFYIPGTEGCLRVSGQVRADYQYTERFGRGDSTLGFYARGRVQLDHRQATAYGLLRTFVRMEIARGSGSRPGGTLGVANAAGLGGTSGITVGPNPSQAFIQFGGLTAGRVTSFFDNADLPQTQIIGLVGTSEAVDTQLLAYTFSFGGGFSATLSLEDPHERNAVAAFPTTGNTLTFAGLNTVVGDRDPFLLVQGGYTVPDVVANVKYNGTWGGFQLSGALHQVRDVGGPRFIGGLPAGANNQAYADSEIGFAVRADAYVKLDALSPGDTAWIAATYTDGATGYISGAGGLSAGLASFAASDGVINPYNGSIATTKAWGIAAGFTHYWVPTLRTGVFASYASFDAPGFASTIVAADTASFLAGTTVGFNDGTAWRVGANTFWTPVSGLDIGVEVIYTKVDPRGIVTGRATGAAGTALRYVGSDDAFAGRIRVQRTF